MGRITNVRNYADNYAIILSGGDDVPTDVVRHAFLHFLLDPLPLMYAHTVVLDRPLYELAAKAPQLPAELHEDYLAWFSECTGTSGRTEIEERFAGRKRISAGRG